MAGWGYYDGGWPAYVPVAKKIANAKKAAEKLRKKGVDIQPVELSGRKIASSFWGKGWCDHMESYHDFENRLPRGRSYVRNGSVVHLEVSKGLLKALVAGSKTYTVEIKVELLSPTRWQWVKKRCAGQIASLLDLLKGKLSDGVMRIVTDRDNGLFPGPNEFKMKCSCPDYADMCKHIAATFYGVGARLDQRPELLFLLRGVDQAELAADGGMEAVIDNAAFDDDQLAAGDLSDIFGIELIDSGETAAQKTKPAKGEAKRKGKGGAAAKDKSKATTSAKVKPRPAKEAAKSTKVAKATKKSPQADVETSSKQKVAAEQQAKSTRKSVPRKTTAAPKPCQTRQAASKESGDAKRQKTVLEMVMEYADNKKASKKAGKTMRSK